MEPSEIEQNVNKIKELIKNEDLDIVNTGLEFLKKLDEPEVYEKLLEGCGIDEEGKLVNDKKEISDYLVLVISSYKDTFTSKIIRNKLSHLDLSYNDFITNVNFLSDFTNLIEVDLSYWEKPFTIFQNKSSNLSNIDGLANLDNLKKLNLTGCNLIPKEICHNSKDFIKKVNKHFDISKPLCVEINLHKFGLKQEEFGTGEWNDKYYEFEATSYIHHALVEYTGTLKDLLDLLQKNEISQISSENLTQYEIKEKIGFDYEINKVQWFDDQYNEIKLKEEEEEELYVDDLYSESNDIDGGDTFIEKGGLHYIRLYMINKVLELNDGQESRRYKRA